MTQKLLKIIFIFFYFNLTLNANFDKGTELLNAVNQKKFKEVKKLIESGANVNGKGKVGFTPLLLAAGWGNVEMVDYLIKNGANLDAKSNRGFGLIHRAAMNKNPAVIKYLLKNYKFNVNDKGKQYCSPLRYALGYNALQNNGTLENARLLFEYGAKKSINWKCNGYTPLMVAVPDEKVVKFLIKNGAKKNIVNAKGQTAHDMAVDQKASRELLKMINFKHSIKKDKKVFQMKNLIWELKSYKNKYDKYSKTEAIEYCKNLQLKNYIDWRVPTVKEYKMILSTKPYNGIVIDGIREYYLNPKDFKYMTPSTYWTKLEDGSLGGQSISWNQIRKKNKNAKYHIRCIKTKQNTI